MCVFFSGEEPESLRGPEAEIVVIDEIARMRYQQSVFDNMMLGLRLGDRPRVLLATTPRTTPFMKRLVTMDDVRITTGSTYDNAEHLSANFLKKVRELYEGTRLGRQELQGAMILDPQNALFKDVSCRRRAPTHAGIFVSAAGWLMMGRIKSSARRRRALRKISDTSLPSHITTIVKPNIRDSTTTPELGSQ
jgi:phage terminase large subunit-like protein